MRLLDSAKVPGRQLVVVFHTHEHASHLDPMHQLFAPQHDMDRSVRERLLGRIALRASGSQLTMYVLSDFWKLSLISEHGLQGIQLQRINELIAADCVLLPFFKSVTLVWGHRATKSRSCELAHVSKERSLPRPRDRMDLDKARHGAAHVLLLGLHCPRALRSISFARMQSSTFKERRRRVTP
ncbi:hypothetical protein BS330_43600 [Amycolatopsis keratiniphila subsp. nogabecina]|nr:hypothetical protein BS330_43600 [Amycolatopsis keratiniphila subsp. nogabecina]